VVIITGQHNICERGGTADALGSGPSGLNARGGSSPLARTILEGLWGRIITPKPFNLPVIALELHLYGR
jgi:hypothetical protein